MRINLQHRSMKASWDVSLCVSGCFWWEHLHLEGSRKPVHSRLFHSCLNGTSSTMGVINVRKGQQRPDKEFLKDQQARLTIHIVPRTSHPPAFWKHKPESDRPKDQISIQLTPFMPVFGFSSDQIVALYLFRQWEALGEMFKGPGGFCSPLDLMFLLFCSEWMDRVAGITLFQFKSRPNEDVRSGKHDTRRAAKPGKIRTAAK